MSEAEEAAADLREAARYHRSLSGSNGDAESVRANILSAAAYLIRRQAKRIAELEGGG